MQIPTRAKRVGLEWCDCEPLASWVCVDLYVGQEVGLRETEQKGTEEVLPS